MESVNSYTAPKIQVIWRTASANSDTAKCSSPFTRQPLQPYWQESKQLSLYMYIVLITWLARSPHDFRCKVYHT